MILFLLIYLSVYGAMHGYLFWKVHQAYPYWNAIKFLIIAFLVFMIFAPQMTHWLDRRFFYSVARVLALVGYSWMGMMLWFVVLAAVGDLWNGGMRLGALAGWSGARQLILAPRIALAAYGILILLASAWGVREASAIRLTTLTVRTPFLGAGSAPIRIAQISDIHAGLIVREGRLGKILKLVMEARPDVLVDTGDLLDASFRALQTEIEMLSAIHPRFGKFAILGNHEYYAGIADSESFIRNCGFRLLRGDSALVADGRVRIAGVDDGASRLGGDFLKRQEAKVLANGAPPRPATLLLKHRPSIDPDSLGKFDLQISGHTHNGQIFPFRYFVQMLFSHIAGFYNLDKGSSLYVSRGSGTWGPPMRLFAPPEVTLIILEPEI